jgi:hypothetical protein
MCEYSRGLTRGPLDGQQRSSAGHFRWMPDQVRHDDCEKLTPYELVKRWPDQVGP